MSLSELSKIVSGGQTGIDQGALAAALDLDFPAGGWCPESRMSEDGVIPEKYPVTDLARAGYAERTLRNVQDSDGTAIIFNEILEGGTRLTQTCCIRERKPFVLIDATRPDVTESVQSLLSFVVDNGIEVLNVAGPRASKWPEAFDRAYSIVKAMLTNVLAGRA